jgi:hypothetical protein
VKHRFYILRDARCPIPGKSYKDLTPKQIEAIYNNFTSLRKAIEEEKPNYENAKIKIPELTKIIFEEITGGYSYKKLYKNEKPEDVFNKLMTGDEKLGHNDQFTVEALIKMKSILATGIRTPEEILETYLNTQTENLPEPKFSL